MVDIVFSHLTKEQAAGRLHELREADRDQAWMAWPDDSYLTDLPEKWSLSRVAEAQGKIAGYAICSAKGDTAWIHRLVVREEIRGSGVGARMLLDFERLSRERGYARVGLKTPVGNSGALKFYEEAGFAEQSRSSEYIHLSKALRPLLVGVHQPNYLPWMGYFYKLSRSDVFVLLDDVLAPSRGYVNRSKVLVQGKGRWLTVPINRNDGFIHHLTPANDEWIAKHLGTLQHNYQRASFFRDLMPGLKKVIQESADRRLAVLNEKLIRHIASLLSISTPLIRASRFDIEATGDERLVDLVRAVGGSGYLSGSGGDNYQAPQTFSSAGIDLKYSAFEKVSYVQQNAQEFVPGLSVVDALFNVGPDAVREMIDESPDIRAARSL